MGRQRVSDGRYRGGVPGGVYTAVPLVPPRGSKWARGGRQEGGRGVGTRRKQGPAGCARTPGCAQLDILSLRWESYDRIVATFHDDSAALWRSGGGRMPCESDW